MQMSRVAGCSIALAVMACAALRVGTRGSPGTPKLEFQNARFDGKNLYGRILVGATGGPVTLDGRLIEHSTVTVEKILDCLTNEEPEWVMADSFPSPPQETDLITINEGYWYGADVDLLGFAPEANEKPSPDCILATINVWPRVAADQKSVPAEIVVRVTKTTIGPPMSDGGTAIDAGSLPPLDESTIPVPPDAGQPDAAH